MISKSERNLSLDLLKIISIIGIIVLHYNNFNYGGLLSNPLTSNSNIIIGNIVEAITIICPNLFVLISGYFLCKDNKIKVRKIANIIIMCFFYGIVIYLLAAAFNIIKIDFTSFKSLILTIINHWFIAIYIVLYILHPFINKLINSLTKKQLLGLILIMFIFFSVWPSFLTDVMVKDGGYGIINFILLYLIAAYIRKYYDEYKIKNYFLFLFLLITLGSGLLGINHGKVYNYNFVGVIISSVIVFMLFKKVNIKNNKVVSSISSCSLATLLIHGHYSTITFMYQEIFKSKLYWNSNYMILHLIISCLLIFSVCVIVELARKQIFKYCVDRYLDKIGIINKIYIVD